MPKNNSLFDNVDEESEIITKNTDIIKKAFASEIKSVDKENYTVHAIVSDDSIDRYNEVIKSGAWKDLSHYKEHPVLVSSHNYGSLNNQIGIAEAVWVEDNKLHAKFKYFVGEGNNEADWGFKLAQKGAAAFSVGFIPLKHENEEIEGKNVKTYIEVELLEISQVLIPANAQALQKGLKSDDPVLKLVARGIKSVMNEDKEKESKMRKDTDSEILKGLSDIRSDMAGFKALPAQIATDTIKIFDEYVKNIKAKYKRKTEQDTLNDVSIQLKNLIEKHKEVSNA